MPAAWHATHSALAAATHSASRAQMKYGQKLHAYSPRAGMYVKSQGSGSATSKEGEGRAEIARSRAGRTGKVLPGAREVARRGAHGESQL
jgi:oxalate decarboxylase/phosphoglucose isomerase-like protein (cupin superfamily)